MNRVLKKAVSFLSAMAVSASVMLTCAAPTTAASPATAKQLLKNQYELVLTYPDGAFFISDTVEKNVEKTGYNGKKYTTDILVPANDAKYYMITSAGKKLAIKNTIGFDKVYSLATTGSPADLSTYSGYSNYYSNGVIVGKGNKYAVILSNGKYLAKGKLFDDVKLGYSVITAKTSKYTYFYNSANGKQLTKVKGTDVGNFLEYDADSKASLTNKLSWDVNGFNVDYFLIKGGKIVKSFENYNSVDFEKSGNTTIVSTRDANDKYEYYTTAGKKTDLRPTANKDDTSSKIPSKTDKTEPKYNLTVRSADDSKGFKVTDSKGKVIAEGSSDGYFSTDNNTTRVNGKLIISFDKLYVINDSTGKIETETMAMGYAGISSVNSKGTVLVLEKRESMDDYNSNYVLVSNKGKELSKTYTQITATGASKNAQYLFKENSKYGFINEKGKVVIKPIYDRAGIVGKTAVVSTDFETYSVISLENGKTLKKNIGEPIDDWTIFHGTYDKPFIVTEKKDSDGNKTYGCILIK